SSPAGGPEPFGREPERRAGRRVLRKADRRREKSGASGRRHRRLQSLSPTTAIETTTHQYRGDCSDRDDQEQQCHGGSGQPRSFDGSRREAQQTRTKASRGARERKSAGALLPAGERPSPRERKARLGRGVRKRRQSAGPFSRRRRSFSSGGDVDGHAAEERQRHGD